MIKPAKAEHSDTSTGIVKVKKGDDIESIVEGNATIRTLVFDRDLSVKGRCIYS